VTTVTLGSGQSELIVNTVGDGGVVLITLVAAVGPIGTRQLMSPLQTVYSLVWSTRFGECWRQIKKGPLYGLVRVLFEAL